MAGIHSIVYCDHLTTCLCYSDLPQYFDFTIEGDYSGLPGVYNANDCADVASSIGSFVGIVTNAIGFGTLPQNKVGVAGSYFEITGSSKSPFFT